MTHGRGPAMISVTYESPYVLHQIGHGVHLMVGCDLRVKIQPDALDSVVVRATGRKKVQFDPRGPVVRMQEQA